MIELPKKRLWDRFKGYLIAAIIIIIYIWAFAGIPFNGIQQMAGQITNSVFAGLLHPDWQFVSAPFDRFLNSYFHMNISSNYTTADGEDLISKLLQTVAIAFLGTFVSAILAIPFSFFAAHTEEKEKGSFRSKMAVIFKSLIFFIITTLFISLFLALFSFGFFQSDLIIFMVVLWLAESFLLLFDYFIEKVSGHNFFYIKSTNGKLLLTFIRVFPEIVLALIFIKAVGPGSFAGVLALSVHSIGMLGKLNGEAVENLDRGPNESIISAGGTNMSALILATLPNAMPNFLSNTLYRFEISVRSASILGMVGAGGIGQDLILSTQVRNWPRAGIILIGVVIMVTLIDFISGQLRKRIA
ncbi:PhnE/PtxC family ABC transporter permease [Oenococcus alcoholitolerans]|uniref:ABC transmembrane type-1 domain-containing protein n=1 Tax=Oenococcus alcoholitolerans TaxID=931074 RepID=A0ABR4XU57_9LACO|nr:hypothetical protein Q757_00340 [Oenococcus alcoholitolerans]